MAEGPIDLNMLAEAAAASQMGNPQAVEYLTAAANREDFWQYTGQICDSECHWMLKFHVLTALMRTIKTRWESIAEEEKAPIRDYVMQKAVDWAQIEDMPHQLLSQVDMALVSILLMEYPNVYPNFVEILVQSASTVPMCRNNLNILGYLCEEALDHGDNKMLHQRQGEVCGQISQYTEMVFNWLKDVLVDNVAGDIPIIIAALKVLKYYIRWIPVQTLVSSPIFNQLCSVYLPMNALAGHVLGLFNELFGPYTDMEQDLAPIVPQVFNGSIQAIVQLIGPATTTDQFQAELTGDNADFVKVLPLVLSNFLQRYGNVLETPEMVENIHAALRWMLALSYCEGDMDTFKTCCDFWHQVCSRVNMEKNNPGDALKFIYGPFLGDIRRLLIRKMERPEEMKITVDDMGNVQREIQRNTLVVNLSHTMFDSLAILTAVDSNDTLAAMRELMDQIRGRFDPEMYHRLCWSVGAITKILPMPVEKDFITTLLRMLLDMCNSCGNPNDRAIIASGMMFICAKYPRFLSKFPDFLRAVIEKLFQFMHEEVEGVMEMAVESFDKITDACKRTLTNGPRPYILTVIQNIASITSALSSDLIAMFYGSLAKVIRSNPTEKVRGEQLAMLMEGPNARWTEGIGVLDPTNLGMAIEFTHILRCNAAVAKDMGPAYGAQLSLIFADMINLYGVYSRTLAGVIAHFGAAAENRDEVRIIKNVKSAIVTVLINFVEKGGDISAISAEIVPPIVGTIMTEYAESVPCGRVADVIALLDALCKKCQDRIGQALPQIFTTVFRSTVDMISQDRQSNVPFRVPFYRFLNTMVERYMEILITADQESFKLIIDCILWGCDHETHEVCELSLKIVQELFKSMSRFPQFGDFLGAYFLPIFYKMFEILTDTIHKFAFDQQMVVIGDLLLIGTRGMSIEQLAESVLPLFQNMDPQLVLYYMGLLVQSTSNIVEFRKVIRDFLVCTTRQSRRDLDFLQSIDQGEATMAMQEQLNSMRQYREQEYEMEEQGMPTLYS